MATVAPTLVLDLDGTLVDTASDLVTALNVILLNESLPALGFDQGKALVGHGGRAMLAAGFAANGVSPSPERLDALFGAFIAHYSAHIADRSAPFPGAVAALDRFASAGWRLAVCTNKLEGLARQLLEKLGLADRFAAIAGQDTFDVRKPHPRHLTETIAHAGGVAATAIMVGDSAIDVATARAAALPIIAVSFGYSPIPSGSLGADRVIDHFDELFDSASALSLTWGGGQP